MIGKNLFYLFIIIIPLKPNLFVYVCKTLFWRVEPRSLLPNPQELYTCGVTITLRVHGSEKSFSK